MYLPREHPVRLLLEQAAAGTMPHKSQLDLLDAYDLPDGMSLSRFRESINHHARNVADIAATGNRHNAAQEAETAWSKLADRMTPEQVAVSGDPDPEPLADITGRMFGPR